MRNSYPLNFEWKYSPEFSEEMTKAKFNDKAFETVDIPHANKEIPFNYFDEKCYQFVSCYRKHFDLPKKETKSTSFILKVLRFIPRYILMMSF